MSLTTPSPDAPTRSPRRTVLVVDDDQSVVSVLRRYLERRDWAVLDAPSGERALEVIGATTTRIDAVVVDLHLPGISGGALCRRIATQHPELARRIVMASGDALAAINELAREALHYRVISKPFDLLDFARLLDDVVATA